MSAQCNICNLFFDSVKGYVSHLQTHSSVSNVRFKCFFSECNQTWKSYSAIKTHIARFHKNLVTKRCYNSHQHGDIKCNVLACDETFSFQNELIVHLKRHIKNGTIVKCPMGSCERDFKNISSLTSHISRYHNTSQIVRNTQYENTNHMSVPNEDANPDQPLEVPIEINHKDTLHNLSLFYIKLFVKFHVPNSTIQLIFDEFSKLQTQSFTDFSQNVLSKLTCHGVSNENALHILNSSWKDIDFMISHKSLKTKHLRYQFFKNHLHYLEPVPIRLGINAQNRPSSYHYIPVKESLKLLLADQTVFNQVKNPEIHKEGLYSDFTDGNVVKENAFFEQSNSVLLLLFYQDVFEIANPLGSARTKHKILAVYYTLGNLHRHNRSKVDPMQLVLLIKEKDFKFFGQEAVFQKLIEDLKDIEREGIIINGEIMKGTIAFIIGDNLGSHSIGGFTENFGTATGYICRFCETTKSQFLEKPYSLTATPRTVQSYDFTVQQLEAGMEAPVRGIKFNSPFNSLLYFHVCNPGLPPCLAHDLFEGVVAHDLAIYIKYFVEVTKAFSYELLNNKIQNFSYHDDDARSKPCIIKKFTINRCKLIGNASQNWCLLRFFLFIIKDYTELIDDSVWRLISLLQEIVALVCAYEISPNQIAYLQILIQDYLYHRKESFPTYPLRPKHHFLMHYPELIMDCGPLIWLWTLRFESKHSFFKKSISTSKNFKNVTGSLAEKHQLLQAYLKSGNYFDLSVQMSQSIQFHVDTYSDAIQSAVSHCQNSHSASCTQAGQSITIRDREYKCGQVIYLEFEQCKLYIGQIKLILYDGLDVHFIVKKLTAVKVPNTQYFEVVLSGKTEFICVPHSTIYGAPLPLYRAVNKEFIVPKQSPPFI